MRSYASAVIEDTKAVSGKILIKGELTVKTLYIAETNDNELQTTEHTMPINQIVEVEKADDESINIIKLVISDLAVSAKSDAAGALRLLDAGAEIRRYGGLTTALPTLIFAGAGSIYRVPIPREF